MLARVQRGGARPQSKPGEIVNLAFQTVPGSCDKMFGLDKANLA
jgi:hypothetical protein